MNNEPKPETAQTAITQQHEEKAPELIRAPDQNSLSLQQASNREAQTAQGISIRDHGFTNGVYGVPEKHFEDFLVNETSLDFYSEQIELTQRKISVDEALRDQLKTDYKTIKRNIYVSQETINQLKHEINQQQEEIDDKRKQVERNEAKANGYPSLHSLVAIILYFVAALIFIAADFVISKNVVADALGMTGWEGATFAAGLAAIPILLKPVYDRLIESPYLNATNTRIFSNFIVIVGCITIILLIALGHFRLESKKASDEIDRIQKKAPDAESFATNDTPASVTSEDKLNTINDGLMSSPSGMISFVLSGILFAVAGTICLGIAFPMIQNKTRSTKLIKSSYRIKGKITLCENHLQELQRKLAVEIASKSASEYDLSLLQNIETLESALEEANNILIALYRERTPFLSQKRVALYLDAYQRGLKETEYYGLDVTRSQIKNDPPGGPGPTIEMPVGTATPLPPGKYSKTRPFIALRKIIAADFRNEINNRTSGEIIEYTSEY